MKKLLLAAALPALLAGCYVGGRGTVAYGVETSPPPPRYVVVEDRPGYVWIDGHWYWNSNSWLWADGYYSVDRPGYVYVQGNYYGRQYRPGYWNRRDYYRGAPSAPSQAGNVIRSGGRSEQQPSRAGGYVAPSRSVAPPSSARQYMAPARSAPPAGNGNNGGGRNHSRDHR